MVIGPALPGCHKPDPRPVAYAGPTLAAGDLGLAQAPETGGNTYVILDTSGTRGRFPCAIAVVRLEQPNPLFVCDDYLFTSERGWEIADVREEEAAYWTGLLRTVPQSRAIYVMDRRSVVSPDCDLKEVIATVRRLRIELCLIYGPAWAPEQSAGLAGVLIDTASGQYLAYVQSQAGVLDIEPPRPDRPRHDLSNQDVNYLAARRFERLARNCILELIQHDAPPAATQPSPWRNMQELRLPSDSVPAFIVPNHRTGG
jgi:hypothetical protein